MPAVATVCSDSLSALEVFISYSPLPPFETTCAVFKFAVHVPLGTPLPNGLDIVLEKAEMTPGKLPVIISPHQKTGSGQVF